MKNIFDDIKENFSISSKDGLYLRENYYIKIISTQTIGVSHIIESHEKEIDIQVLFEGCERIKLFSKENVSIKEKYNKAIDSTFYYQNGSHHSEVILQPEYFAMFFPQDIHNPLIAHNGVQFLKKLVVKINLNWFKSLNK